ncbi:hypothetical protein BWR18_05375 [Tateyamaria omphalii]|uniref:Uncharacterized protein n=2 Tax=Tateyamaria omphalii TaxID=299262 RepID=A0A1P8N0M6_9RHOB|nr:hypothetical protein BWR18_05375 [Tateyamaria omphalii]
MVIGLSVLAKPVSAQQLMFEYYTMLTPQDTYNSRGAPLNDVCGIVQQDRANVHKFGRRDAGDSVDPFFTTAERRAMIAGRCQFSKAHHTVARIRSAVVGFVLVRVFGNGSAVSRVEIYEAAG